MFRLAFLIALLPVAVVAEDLPVVVGGLDTPAAKERRPAETKLLAAGSNAVPVLVAALTDARPVVREEGFMCWDVLASQRGPRYRQW